MAATAAAARRSNRREEEAYINALREVPEEELLCRDPGIAHGWERKQNFHVIRARFRGTPMQMIARDSQCHRCGKVKQERWTVGKNDTLVKAGNYYSSYKVVLHGFGRGRNKASAIWTAGYRNEMERQASRARKGTLKAV